MEGYELGEARSTRGKNESALVRYLVSKRERKENN
jgi:hypothetical protein